MVTGIHTAYRCKDCDNVIFKPREHKYSLIDMLKKCLGLLACPKCGSRNIVEDKHIRT